ncbi:MAG: hypothetical protein KGI79_01400 [Patescibacteria group bacterium]|nr:hypothetical protein [Patescibacteria group bacterium]MDE2116514.1 hypothetical protein [Patescibacteria group bacterium]
MTASPLTIVRRLFGELRVEKSQSRRNEYVRQLFKILSAESYREGEIAHIVSGGILDNGFTKQPTGILKIRPLHFLYWKYSEVDWGLLIEHKDAIPSRRFVYVASVFYNAFKRAKDVPESFDAGINLLHLNTYLRVPLYSSAATRGATAKVNQNYGFPATYVAEAFPVTSQEYRLSECSLDIVTERRRSRHLYNRGYLFRLPDLSQVFYFDRKANIQLQNDLAIAVISRFRRHDLIPKDNDVRQVTTILRETMEIPAQRNLTRLTRNLLKNIQDLRYSVLGSCLFELIHEFLSDSEANIHSVNGALQSLDPRQKAHWSTRAFRITSYDHLSRVIRDKTKGNDAFDRFLAYLWDELPIRLGAMLGDNFQAANACAINGLLFEPFYSAHFSAASDGRPTHALMGLETSINEFMGSHLLTLMAKQRVGSICIPFQADNRGEFLMTPLINDAPHLSVDRVRIHVDAKPPSVTIEERGITARVVVSHAENELEVYIPTKGVV